MGSHGDNHQRQPWRYCATTLSTSCSPSSVFRACPIRDTCGDAPGCPQGCIQPWGHVCPQGHGWARGHIPCRAVSPLSPTHIALSLICTATPMSPLSPQVTTAQVPPLCHHCPPLSATVLFLSPPQAPPLCPCCHPKCHHFVPLKCLYSVPAVTLNTATLSLLSPPKCHHPVPSVPATCHHPIASIPR